MIWIVMACLLLGFVEFMSFEKDLSFANMGVAMRRLKPWRRRLEAKIPWLKYFRRPTTQELWEARARADVKEKTSPPDNSVTHFQKVCGEVDALQEIQNHLNMMRPGMGRVKEPNWTKAYWDGFMAVCQGLEAKVARRKDPLVWWLIRHGVDLVSLGHIVVSVKMVERIAKRLNIQLDQDDPTGFQTTAEAEAMRVWRIEWHRKKFAGGTRSEDHPMVAVGDVLLSVAFILTLKDAPMTTKDGVDGYRLAMAEDHFIFIPKSLIEETVQKYSPKA